MLFFLVSCLSFLLLSQSFLKPHPASKIEFRIWAFPWISFEVFQRFSVLMGRKRKIFISVSQVPKAFPSIKRFLSARSENLNHVEEEKDEISLLDLPDLVLDCIIEKLSPSDLCSMAGVCSYLREKCTSDHLWEKHIKQKWGGVIGEAAYREWQCQQIASKMAPKFLHSTAKRSKFRLFSGPLEFLKHKSELKDSSKSSSTCSLPPNSVMSCYLALESGKFWFPAQVFNRENGNVGFMLSCYDAQLSYDSMTDNFVASAGRTMIEEAIEWDRIRAPSVNTPANVLHISDCLHELKPDDHIEIQWTKNKEFPYGWWYGVVGHLDSCNANEFNCLCHISDTVVLEFKQYSPGSRWRKAMISRKDHREEGNEVDGFYGGIRKLHKKEDIGKWKHLWPNRALE
ncbi:UNVERIFIED_CONTAM: F-box protein [Sesamum angustifolium]|uniref:F-box protein n=1 Tax=Sesamum angustifolium TaxID=2727405 RepID=A0AAW2PVX2_9LAMI